MRLSTVFWASAILYLITALISKTVYSDLLPGPGTAPLAYALAFLGVIAVSYRLSGKLDDSYKTKLYLAVLVVVLFPLGWWGLILALAIIGATEVIIHYEARGIESNPENARRELRIILTITVLVLFAIPIAVGAVPVLRPEARYSVFRLFYLAAGYFTVVVLSLKPDFRMFLLGEAIAIVSTFRTVGLAVALAYFLRMVQLGNPTTGIQKRRRYFIIGAVLITLLAVFVIRYYTTVQTYPGWSLGFFETLLYRPGVTYTVYERLLHLGMPWGKRGILFSTDPKGYVGSLFGRNVGYTYTIFGQPAYDFGILGLVEGAFLGMALADAERRRPTAVLSVTLMTLMVPIGVDAFFLSAMAFLAYLSVEVDVWKRSH